jgi:hypothetical protein
MKVNFEKGEVQVSFDRDCNFHMEVWEYGCLIGEMWLTPDSLREMARILSAAVVSLDSLESINKRER